MGDGTARPGQEADAAALDRADPLAAYRERFVVADDRLVYLDGNSLGRLPHRAVSLAAEVVRDQWGGRLVRHWNEGWLEVTGRIGDKIGRLVGATPGEVVLADSTTVCLYKAAVAALRARPGRGVVVTDDANFPSDIQALRAAAATVGGGHTVVVVPGDGVDGPVDAVADALDDTVALVSLSHVAYRSGWCWDLSATTAVAHAAGALVLWDLSHSVGVVPIDLGAAKADLAVGCTYKYLNGGPGAPAFLYVPHDRSELVNPVAGWQGSDDPFRFDPDAGPAPGVAGFVTGTPPIVSAALVEPGVDLVLEAGVDAIRAKSEALTQRFVALADGQLASLGFNLATPRDPARRGSHVSLTHPDARAVGQALIHEQDTIGDFRPPDMLRYGFAPLYTTYAEVDAAIQRTAAVVTDGGADRWRGAAPVVP